MKSATPRKTRWKNVTYGCLKQKQNHNEHFFKWMYDNKILSAYNLTL